MRHRLADIDPTPDTVELPSGREVILRHADAGAIELLIELEANPGDLQKQLAIVQRILPDASAEELRQLTMPMIAQVVKLGTARGLEVYQRMGESSAPGAKSTRRSPPAPRSRSSASA